MLSAMMVPRESFRRKKSGLSHQKRAMLLVERIVWNAGNNKKKGSWEQATVGLMLFRCDYAGTKSIIINIYLFIYPYILDFFGRLWLTNQRRLCLGSKMFSFLFLFRPLLRGEELYTQMCFFFVQTIFADRYIHRKELRLVSLESSSSVENAIKKILFITRSCRALNFWEN